MRNSFRWLTALVPAGMLFGSLWLAQAQTSLPAPQVGAKQLTAKPGNIPIQFDIPANPAGGGKYVTLVIEDKNGKRIRNLIAETNFPPGHNSVTWDGYDDNGNLVPPGSYQVRGLTHDGLKLIYEFPYNTAGNPPWFVAGTNRYGAWMADHSVPAGAVFLPKGTSPYGQGKPQIMLTGIVCESGDPIIFTDTTGQKVYGNHYFGWDGGVALARDVGTKGRKDIAAYVLIGFQSKEIILRAINTKGEMLEVAKFRANNAVPREPASIGLSAAVYNNLAVVSVPGDNQLVLIDVQKGKVLSRVSLDKPKGLAFDPQGKLFAISGTTIKQFALNTSDPAKPDLGTAQWVVTEHLEAPYNLTLDAQGNIFVADLGKSHQVKVFSASGSLVRTIGHPGGLQLGHYDEQRMQHPNALALDDQGQLWVAEYDAYPKRVSIWNATTGSFIKGLYGPPMYGGGGTIDAEDKTKLYYAQYGGLTQWKINWEKGEVKLENICVRREMMGTPTEIERWHVSVPERPVHLNGRTYLIPTYNGGLRGNDNAPIYLMGDDGIAWPVAFVGTLRRWGPDGYDKMNGLYKYYPPHTEYPILDDVEITWSDLNFDHKVQYEEFKFRAFTEYTVPDGRGGQKRLNRKEACQYFPDLSANLAWMMHISAPTFDSKGVPIFDLKTIKPLLPLRASYGGQEEGGWGISTKDGHILEWYTTARNSKGDIIWSYPTHGMEVLPQKGGDMIEATRLLGPLVVAKKGQAGEWMAINGERGNMYFMTTDGLFIQTVGGDMRTTPLLREPKAVRGMVIDSPEKHISFEDEHFHPTITQTKDGEIYLCAGKEFSAVFRVDGMASVSRISPIPVVITPELVAGMPSRLPVVEKKLMEKLPVVMSSTPVAINADLTDWSPKTVWAQLDPHASAAVTIADGKLIAAYKTGDPHAIDNDANNFRFMFKSGGALDLFIRPEPTLASKAELYPQDRRLLVAKVRGKPTAVLFSPETDKTSDSNKTLYESPIGKVRFDKVEDVSSQLTFAEKDGTFVIAVPLKLLNLDPKSQTELRGDIGIIRGNGTQNTQRLYWHNRNTSLVSDIPSEARFAPPAWGRFQMVGQPREGTVKLGAEQAELVGRALRLKGTDEETYAVGFWMVPEEYIRWSNIPVKAGTYDVFLNYGCGSKDSTFTVSINDQSLKGQTVNTGSWDTYTLQKIGTVTLTDGQFTITVKPGTVNVGLMDFRSMTLEKTK